jgi:alpha-tubulin suppressor-like RCC1 family protein
VPNGVPDEENSCVPPDTTASWTAVSTGARHVCAVTSKGTLWCWGDNHYAQLGFGQLATVAPPTALATDGWTAVTAGNDFTCGVRNKVIYCWGKRKQCSTRRGQPPGRAGAVNATNTRYLVGADTFF